MPQFSLLNVIDGQVVEQKCTACSLADNPKLKTNCMAGLGKPGASLMFVGKAPGTEDDGIGQPMTGANGRLFNDLLDNAGFQRNEYYITNCVKCAPMDAPLKDKHWASCKSHLKHELKTVKPLAIVAVGAEALKWLTGQSGVKKLRRHGIPSLVDHNLLVFPMLQPAQVFHAQGSAKDRLKVEMIDDLKWLRTRMLEGRLGRQDEMDVDYKQAVTVEDVYEFLIELTVDYPVSFDLETADKSFEGGRLFPDERGLITAIGFSKGPGHARAIPLWALGMKTLHYWTDEELYGHVLPAVKAFLRDRVVFGHNAPQFDQKWIRYMLELEYCKIDFDTMLANYLIDEESGLQGLETLAKLHTDMTPWKSTFQCRDIDKLCLYLCKDVDATFRIRQTLEPKLDPTLKNLFNLISLPLANALSDMELRGALIDMDKMKELDEILTERLDEEEGAIRAMDGVKAYELEKNTRFNLASPKDLSTMMGEYLKLPCIEKTNNGGYSTNARVLDALKDEPFVKHLLQVRGLQKLKGTYCEGMKKRIESDGRIHTSFFQDTVTGRLSSSNPNLQNIPRKATAGRVIDDGRIIKAVFKAPEGRCLIQADYSQAELRTLAMYSLDPNLIEAYLAGLDVHTSTAAKVYGITDLSQVSGDQRNAAKTVNFGIIYGRTIESIITQFQQAALADVRNAGRAKGDVLNEAGATAKSFWDGHQKTYGHVWRWMAAQEKQIREHGYQETFFGRRRRYEHIDPHAIRQAYNFPIQSTASDFTLLSVIRVSKMLKEFNIRCYPILTVHDSIIFECDLDAVWDAADIIKGVMEGLEFPFMNVPLVADLELGFDWGHMKKMDVENRKIA